MEKGTAHWTYHPDLKTWYFELSECAAPPWPQMLLAEAWLDLDSDGRLAGVQIFVPDGQLAEPPSRT